MTDRRLRTLERAARAGDPGARQQLRRERLRTAPEDVSALQDDLQLRTWNALPAAEREEVAGLFAGLLAVRRRPMDLLEVRGFGPGAEQPIARYRDRATGLIYALIPGGTLEPGLTEEQVERVLALGAPRGLLLLPRARSGTSVPVRPFLMSIAPVPVGCPTLPPGLREGTWSEAVGQYVDPGRRAVPCYLAGQVLADAQRAAGARLPTADQLEWAARGGARELFPWGDDLGPFEEPFSAVSEELAPPRDAVRTWSWPRCSRFGLLAPGAASVWCVADEGRLRCWGGAHEWSPWGGPAWLAAVNGFTRADDGDPHALLPVIPIGPP